MPYGWYLPTNSNKVNKGDLIVFKPDFNNQVMQEGRDRGYIKDNITLLKKVIATQGDIVLVSKEGVFVNNILIANSKRVLKDGAGRKLPYMDINNYEIKEGEVFVYTPFFKSFDSRYFGVIKEEQIIYKVIPVITF